MVYILGVHCYQLLFSRSLYQFEILSLIYLVVMQLCRMNLARVELVADWSPAAGGFLASIWRSQIFS